jgi:hypothetical protein
LTREIRLRTATSSVAGPPLFDSYLVRADGIEPPTFAV